MGGSAQAQGQGLEEAKTSGSVCVSVNLKAYEGTVGVAFYQGGSS